MRRHGHGSPFRATGWRRFVVACIRSRFFRYRRVPMVDTQVLIVGAGPVGLILAVDLGLRGVRCTLVEQKEAPQFLPKMERCNARTMEIFRRMGLADRIDAAGAVPTHLPVHAGTIAEVHCRAAAERDGALWHRVPGLR